MVIHKKIRIRVLFFAFSENIFHSSVYFFLHYQKEEISMNNKLQKKFKKADILT